MAVILYTSEDAGAIAAGLVVTGETGRLITLLTAVLVNGYSGKSAAGWSVEFVTATKAVYKPVKLAHEQQPFYRVDDSVTTYANIAGFRNMTSADAGDFRFPSTGNRYMVKSSVASTATRRWKILANNRTAFIMIQSGGVGAYWEYTQIGAFNSYRPQDPCPFLLEASTGITVMTGNHGTTVNVGNNNPYDITMTSYASTTPIAIGYSGQGDSVTGGKHTDNAKMNSNGNIGGSSYASGVQQFNPADGSIYLAPLWIHEPTRVLRGKISGIWCPAPSSLMDEQVITGVGEFSGKTIMGLWHGTSCQIAYEISDTWST